MKMFQVKKKWMLRIKGMLVSNLDIDEEFSDHIIYFVNNLN